MKGKSILTTVVAVVLAAWATGPVLGAYTSIQHNLVDADTDCWFNVNTGQLRIADSSTNLTLNDDPPLPGGATVVSASFELLTTLVDYNVTYPGKALFKTGSLNLNFVWDPDGGGSQPPASYHIGGYMAGFVVTITEIIPKVRYQLDGEGRFDAGTPTLPGTNVWPAPDWSSIDSLTVALGANLQGFVWNNSFGSQGRYNTMYTLFPNDAAIPEPAALGLLGLGSLLIRRRRV